MATEATLREDTMIYRTPADDSDPSDIHDVWGVDLETRVVDAAEVDNFVAQGWVAHPSHIDNPPKPEEAAGFVPDRGASDAHIQELTDQLAEANATIARLTDDLKAAEELANSESKAKDEALAKLAGSTNSKPAGTLSTKSKPAS